MKGKVIDMESKVQQILDTTAQKIRAVADADTIIGKPIVIDGDITILPVSKMSCGFASGGSDFPVKAPDKAPAFGGAGGGGVTITPVAFIVVNKGNVRIININTTESPLDKAISMIPELIDKIKELFAKDEVSSCSCTEDVSEE